MKASIVVRVGSLNRAKLAAVRRGLDPFFERVEVEACSVESGVSEQPIGFAEIVTGARNRARDSWDPRHCQLAAGIEDGLVQVDGTQTGFVNIGCCVLYDGDEEAIGLTAGFEYPPQAVRAATGPARHPIGGAFDAIFVEPEGWEKPGPCAGNIGRLTNGALTRDEYGAQAVTCAFVRLLHPALYGGDGT